MKKSAIILTSGNFNSRNAKTAFGLVRKSEYYKILAVIDHNFEGQDAGVLVDGKKVNIPSYRVKLGQSITLTEKGLKLPMVVNYLEEPTLVRPAWISFEDQKALRKGKPDSNKIFNKGRSEKLIFKK